MHGPDLRRFAVAVWRLVRDERHLHVDRARLRRERDLQLQAVEQRPELRLGQVLKPLAEKPKPHPRPSPAIGIYIDWYGVKSWTGPPARFARNSALTSPRSSP